MTNALRFILEALPEMTFLFLCVSFLVGILNEFVPEERFRAALSAGHARGYLAGAALGSLTPFCSCSTVPIVMGLLRARTDFGPTMTFLFTSPLLNPIIATLFLVNFGIFNTALYGGVVLGFSVLAGWLLERAGMSRQVESWVTEGSRPGTACCCGQKGENGDPGTLAPLSVGTRVLRVFRESVRLFFSFLPYMLLGLGMGAFMHDFLPADLITNWTGSGNPLGIPLSAIIGVPLYVRVSAMIPLSPILLAKGMGVGAFVALVIGGAGASLPEVILLKRIFKWRLILSFVGAVFVMATVGGILFQFLV
jgi:uncharacterized membrane protein YraQ (UPF0718 family)